MEDISVCNRPKELVSCWKPFIYKAISRELNSLARYCTRVLQWEKREEDVGILLEEIDNDNKNTGISRARLPEFTFKPDARDLIIINGNFNYDFDIEESLRAIYERINRHSRVAIVTYNPYYSFLFRLANKLRIRKATLPNTFLTAVDYENIARLSGFQIVRHRSTAYFPFRLFGLGEVLNKLCSMIPLLNRMGIADLLILRPVIESPSDLPSLSIVIPARNESGNIENAIKRMPVNQLGQIELIFVEGHSTDDTWEVIQRVQKKYEAHFDIKIMQQTGKGKVDAVRLGFQHAKHDLLTILDADLTMPPELLPRFYQAYTRGLADFINGTRLVYPMEGAAMRPLNKLGNIFFAKALSHVLGTRFADTLCGTKLLSRADYRRMTEWREDFGDFDPFGDFELLFPAAILGLGIIDVPIRYRDRTYGSTNISRFRHGAILLKMTIIGFFRIRVSG